MRRLGRRGQRGAEKYDRVEKKSNILDATADAVDKNFQAIGELERNVRTIDAQVREIPDRVIDLKRSLDEVMAWKPKLDAPLSGWMRWTASWSTQRSAPQNSRRPANGLPAPRHASTN